LGARIAEKALQQINVIAEEREHHAGVAPSQGYPLLKHKSRHCVPRIETLLQGLVEVLRGSTCQARMHWGKAGWDKWASCFDGAIEYAATWCSFGCAVEVLPPPSPCPADLSVGLGVFFYILEVFSKTVNIT